MRAVRIAFRHLHFSFTGEYITMYESVAEGCVGGSAEGGVDVAGSDARLGNEGWTDPIFQHFPGRARGRR